MRILVYTALNEQQQHQLKEELSTDSELIFKSQLTDEQLIRAFDTAEIILGNPPVSLFKRNLSKLRFWQIDSAGFDQYQDLKLSIPVANMGTFFALSCAETIVGGILCFYRQIHQLVRLQSAKKWKGKQIRTKLQGMQNKNVLILGSGAIGIAVKSLLSGFGCQIRTTARKNPAADLHRQEDILAVLPEIDLVINTLPGTAEKYVSASFFAALKPGCLYSNVGRGNTTDEKALQSALKNGKLSGAVLDVTQVEPLPEDHVFWTMENVILTQHTGGGDQYETEGKLKQFITNINRFVKGQPLQDLVDLRQGY